MLKLEHTEVLGWEHAIRGMRNPMNSWAKSDSKWVNPNESYIHHEHNQNDGTLYGHTVVDEDYDPYATPYFQIGPNDLDLMRRLRNAGTDHRKFMRMIAVYVDITAPLYWWKEMDTYQVGVVKNSCSTMHKIAAKEFTLEDFSCEHLNGDCMACNIVYGDHSDDLTSLDILKYTIEGLNYWRRRYLTTKNKDDWWQMIQLLPSSYNQRRTVMLNYEVLANIYKSRRNHKLDEWRELCEWIETLPYSELIVGERSDGTGSESKRFVEIAQVFQKSFQEGLEEGLTENKELVFKIPKDHISPEALELLEKGFAVDMSLGFKEE